MKRYLIMIVFVLIFISVIIAIAINVKVEDSDKYFLYVKENNLILWNESNNQKYILNSDFDSSNKIMFDIYSKYSFDKTKIIYADSIENNYVDLKYIDLSNINEINVKLIAEDVFLYETTEKGIVYIKNTDLYYYDYVDTNKIASNIVSYVVSKNKKDLFYLLEDGNVYKVNLNNLEENNVSSDKDGINIYGDLVLLYNKDDILLTLYDDNKIISDKVINILNSEGNTLYFARYEGNLNKFETEKDYLDLNSNIATYRYQNGEITKIGDGILNLGNGFTDIKKDDYLVLGQYNGTEFDISFYSKETNDTFYLGSTNEYNIYGYDDSTKTVYYQGKDNLFYQAKLVDEKLQDNKLIGENIALFIKNNNDIYYVENNTFNLYLIQENENILIAEDVKDWIIIDNILYYMQNKDDKLSINCHHCNMQQINDIDSFTSVDNEIFNFTNTNLKNDVLYGDLYMIVNGINVLIDNDVVVSYGITPVNGYN